MMRHFLLCLSFALFIGLGSLTDETLKNRGLGGIFDLEGTINQTLEGLKKNIQDPLTIKNMSVDFPADGIITGGANISNFECTGLTDFTATELHFSTVVLNSKLNFTLLFPSINVNTNFWADMEIAQLVPIYGEGTANVHIRTLEVQGYADINTLPPSLNDLQARLRLEDAVFDIHGLIYNEEFSLIVSRVLNDVGVKFINEHPDLVSEFLSPVLSNIVNGMLNPGKEDV